jgi:hypothetical protein
MGIVASPFPWCDGLLLWDNRAFCCYPRPALREGPTHGLDSSRPPVTQGGRTGMTAGTRWAAMRVAQPCLLLSPPHRKK